MAFLSFLRRPPEEKRSRAQGLVAFSGMARPSWTGRDPRQAFAQAVKANPVAARAVRRVAEAAAEIPMTLVDQAGRAAAPDLDRLLARPNPGQDRLAFLSGIASHLLVAGDAYVEAVTLGGAPRELHVLRPDRMSLTPGRAGAPDVYTYSVGGDAVRFVQDGAIPPLLHMALPHPFDDHFGLSPLDAALAAIDIHNAATAWTKALLDNAARPSGALVYSGGDGTLSEDQYERLKAELAAGFSGAANAGRPLLLEGGLDWKPLSLTPKDMDFMEAKRTAAREIALAFGVPPIVLGIPGDATYANFKEANAAFHRDTAIPLARRMWGALTAWLAPGEAIEALPDEDAIGALADDRAALWARVGSADFLSEAEKRVAVGYPADKPGAAVEVRYSPDQPRLPAGQTGGGQWTSGGGGDSLSGGDGSPTEMRNPPPRQQGRPNASPAPRPTPSPTPNPMPSPPPVADEEPIRNTEQLRQALGWFSQAEANDTLDGPKTVFEARGRDYAPDGTGGLTVGQVREMTREELDRNCPKHESVQEMVTRHDREVRTEMPSATPSQLGSEVHRRVANEINGPGGWANPRDPNFRAEYSLLPDREGRYSQQDTTRFDVYERPDRGGVCIYDIKTGNARLDLPRMDGLGLRSFQVFGNTWPIYVLRIKP